MLIATETKQKILQALCALTANKAKVSNVFQLVGFNDAESILRALKVIIAEHDIELKIPSLALVQTWLDYGYISPEYQPIVIEHMLGFANDDKAGKPVYVFLQARDKEKNEAHEKANNQKYAQIASIPRTAGKSYVPAYINHMRTIIIPGRPRIKTDADLARLLGTYPSVIKAIMEGSVYPGGELLERMKEHLSIPAEFGDVLQQCANKDNSALKSRNGRSYALATILGEVTLESNIQSILKRLYTEHDCYDVQQMGRDNPKFNPQTVYTIVQQPFTTSFSRKFTSKQKFQPVISSFATTTGGQALPWAKAILEDITFKNQPRKSLKVLLKEFIAEEEKTTVRSELATVVRFAGFLGKKWGLSRYNAAMAISMNESAARFAAYNVGTFVSNNALANVKDLDGSTLEGQDSLNLRSALLGNPQIGSIDAICFAAEELMDHISSGKEIDADKNILLKHMQSLQEQHGKALKVAHREPFIKDGKPSLLQIPNAVFDMLNERSGFNDAHLAKRMGLTARFGFFTECRQGMADLCIFPNSKAVKEKPQLAGSLGSAYTDNAATAARIGRTLILISGHLSSSDMLKKVNAGEMTAGQMHRRWRRQKFLSTRDLTELVNNTADNAAAKLGKDSARCFEAADLQYNEMQATTIAKQWFPVSEPDIFKHERADAVRHLKGVEKKLPELITPETLKAYVQKGFEEPGIYTFAGFITLLKSYKGITTITEFQEKIKFYDEDGTEKTLNWKTVKSWEKGGFVQDREISDALALSAGFKGKDELEQFFDFARGKIKIARPEVLTELLSSEDEPRMGQLIKELRLAAAFSQEEAADLCGIGIVIYKKFEKTGNIVVCHKGCKGSIDEHKSTQVINQLSKTLVHHKYENFETSRELLSKKLCHALQSKVTAQSSSVQVDV